MRNSKVRGLNTKQLHLFRISILVLGICFMFAASVTAATITDPMHIGVGARPLGMGKAYVAYAEDGETLFFNPAGLGQIKSVKLTSMYTSLVTDVNYLMVGGIYPNAEGTSAFGVGLISSGVSDIDLTDAGGNSLGTGSWNNSVLVMSYGSDFKAMGGFLDNLKVGAALKYYSSGGAGTSSIEAASGSGFDVDLGMLYNPTPWVTVGINAQNILPSSMGGVITRDTGIQESIASATKAGLRINLLGDGEKALAENEQVLALALDIDYPNLQQNVSTAFHVGAEYWPAPALALRVGMDQDASANGIDSNLTAGMGVRMGGLEFDYAYHPYAGVTDDTTHYFSLAYVGEEIKPIGPAQVSILDPGDKQIVYDNEIKITGKVANVNLKHTEISVDGKAVMVDKEGNFKTTVAIKKLGKKLIVVEARDLKKNKIVAASKRRIIRLTSYQDVGKGYWAKLPIEQVATVGLIEGYPDGTFKPDRTLTRAELATLLVRALGLTLTNANQPAFKDVPVGHWANAYVKTAQLAGFIQGYPDGSFKPDRMITKAEGIAVLARVDKLPLVPKVEINPFADVIKKHWAAKYILAAKNAGMLNYMKYSYLGPKDGLSRAEAVTMLSKTKFAGKKVKELMSWVTGFESKSSSKDVNTPYVAMKLETH